MFIFANWYVSINFILVPSNVLTLQAFSLSGLIPGKQYFFTFSCYWFSDYSHALQAFSSLVLISGKQDFCVY